MKKIIIVWVISLSIFCFECFAMSSHETRTEASIDIEARDNTVQVIGEDICPICQTAISEPATSDMPPYIDCTCCCCVKNVCLLGVDPRTVVTGKVSDDPKRCNHKIHYRCLLGWQQAHGNKCPICGAPSFCILEDPSVRRFDRCQKALYWIPATLLVGGVLTYICLFVVRLI